MRSSPPADITQLLHRIEAGDDEAKDALLEILYSELHHRADRAMRGQPSHHTLQATALVNEAYLKLLSSENREWKDRVHFLSVAAQAMRQILVDHARGKDREKRMPENRRVALDQVRLMFDERAMELPALDDALCRLARFDPTMAKAVELHFFGGLTMQETADTLGLSKRALERRWRNTRLWLYAQLQSPS